VPVLAGVGVASAPPANHKRRGVGGRGHDFLVLTINVPVVYMGRYEVVLRGEGDYP
jgi:hypothetical protein